MEQNRPGSIPFWGPRPMLMHFDKSAIHHYGIQLKLAGQAVVQLLKDAGFSPAKEPLVHRVPFPNSGASRAKELQCGQSTGYLQPQSD